MTQKIAQPDEAEVRALVDRLAQGWARFGAERMQRAVKLEVLSLEAVAGKAASQSVADPELWPAAFLVPLTDDGQGKLIFLLKKNDAQLLQRLSAAALQPPALEHPMAAATSLINAVVDDLAGAPGQTSYLDLSVDGALWSELADESLLWLCNCRLVIEGESPIEIWFLLVEAAGPLQTSGATPETELRQQGQEGALAQEQRRTELGEQIGPMGIDRLLDVELDLILRFGKTEMRLQEVVELEAGSIIELDEALGEPVELRSGGHCLARAELVAVGGYYGVRIIEVTPAAERLRLLR
jgi:flagellar motor switch protein FliN